MKQVLRWPYIKIIAVITILTVCCAFFLYLDSSSAASQPSITQREQQISEVGSPSPFPRTTSSLIISPEIKAVASAVPLNEETVDSQFFEEKVDDDNLENTASPLVSGEVLRILDGDTFVISLQGQAQTIRLIGVDAPESASTRTRDQCYGDESAKYLHEQLLGKVVSLERDDTQDDSDKYKRFLRYIYVDEQLLNLSLIAEGYAREYTYKKPYRHQAAFRQAQLEAQIGKKGLWAAVNCP